MDTPIIRQRHSKNRVVAARDVTKSATNRQITPTETDKSRPPVADDRVAETDEETTTNNNSDEEEASSIEEDAALSPKPAHAQQQQQQPIRDDDAAAAHSSPGFSWTLDIDPMAVLLFAVACATRLYRLAEPNHIVFDELHYGKYVSLYMRRTFFFDPNPPLGKQLIAGVAYLAGYSGNFTFSRIGGEYSAEVPTHALRMLPALCGSVLAPCVYKLLLEVRVQRWMAVVGGLLIILDNALLTQSRFILLETILLTFALLGLLFLLRCQSIAGLTLRWLLYASASAVCLACAVCVKFVGFYTALLAAVHVIRHICVRLLPDRRLSAGQLLLHVGMRALIFVCIPAAVYVAVFYAHLSILHRAGPHDSIMTSAFQASLDGGLASITKGQPLRVVHGSQITLRHTLGRTCWMHSHPHVYPVRYADGRGSSHQQQVTCYSFKDVNNWWIVKRPDSVDLVVGEEPQPLRHGEHIQLVHGITSRALNSHDVAAAMTPQSQEVSCYIDYNVSMPAQLLWRLEVVNRAAEGEEWHAIRSQVRLVHVTTGLALRFSGRQLPEWGFNQHEIVADRVLEQTDTIWNVEEHRYTQTEDQKERERQLLKAEMIPTAPTVLTFWQKFVELHSKMMWHTEATQSHMYSSEPLEWPLLSKGIAYWVDKDSNAQIHLLGNVAIWYSGTAALLVYAALYAGYLLRRRRQCYDLSAGEWQRFQQAGELFFIGYGLHFVPYLFVERTMFLHNYMPAFVFKVLLLCFVLDHIGGKARERLASVAFASAIAVWLAAVAWVYVRFLVLSYGTTRLSPDDLIALRWKDTWDFILHKDLPVIN